MSGPASVRDVGSQAKTSDQERSSALRWGLITAVIQRGVGALIPLVSVPLALGHLGAVNYGAWAIAVSLTTVFGFADLGIGTGLMTRLGGRVRTEAPDTEDRALVSSGYAMVVCVALVLLLSLGVLAATTNVGTVLGAEGSGDVEPIVCLTLGAFIVGIAVSIIVRVQYAVGQQSSSNLWQTGGSLAMLAGIWFAAEFTDWPGWFILAAACIPVLTGVINSLWFFGSTRIGKALSPRLGLANAAMVRSLLSLGSRFMLIGVLLAASVALDPWIVARTTDLAEVPNFAVPFRLLASVASISVLALMPLWPMHARAVRERDVAWIRRITWRLCVLATTCVAVIAAAVVLGSDLLVEYWLDGTIVVDHVMWSGLAAMCVAQAMTGPFFMVQNGAEVLGPQTFGYALLVATIPLKWWVASAAGYEWIPWVSLGGYLAFVLPACGLGYRRALEIARRPTGEVVT